MRQISIFAFLFLVLALTSCAPDPRKEAQAYAITTKAQQDALDQEQARQQSADMHELDVRNAEVIAQRHEATAGEINRGLIKFAFFVFTFGTAAICYTVFRGSQIVVKTLQGIGEATEIRAMHRASLLPLDANGNYPAYIARLGGGRYSITDLNTHTTMLLDVKNDPDAQMVAAAMAIRQTFVLASQSVRAADSGQSISKIDPSIVHPQIIDLEDVASLVRKE
jgi:hypothetical protein